MTSIARPRKVSRLVARVPVPPSLRLPLLVFGWAQLVLLAWWAGQYPGLMSPDSTRYVIHVTSGPWTADHSVLYDSFVLASLKLVGNLALLTFLQTTVAAAIIAFGVSSMHRAGVRARWAVIPGLLMPCIPSVGAFVPMVWKDVPFTFAEALLAVTTLRLLTRRRARETDGEDGSPKWLLASMFAEFVGMVLFRNDGFVMLVAAAILLVIALKGLRIKVIALALAALALFGLCEKVIYPAGGIQPAASSLAYGTFYGDIAIAYSKAPSLFSPAERAVLAKVAPLHHWRHASDCYTSDPLFRRPFSLQEADKYRNDLASIWIHLLARAPVLMVESRLCRGTVGWDPFPPPSNKASLGELPHVVPADLYGAPVPAAVVPHLQPRPLIPVLGRVTQKLRSVSDSSMVMQVLFFRGASWCYLLYLALALMAWRLRRWDLLAIGAVSLANQLSVIADNPAQLYRYMVGPIFMGALLWPLFAARRQPHSPAAELSPTTVEAAPVLSSAGDAGAGEPG